MGVYLDIHLKKDKNKMDIAKVIAQYNLSVRYIPLVTYGLHEMRYHKEGNEIIITENGRKLTKETIIPKNAGKYMIKQVNNTILTVQWNSHDDNLSDTLEGSISLFLSKIENKA